MAKNVGVQKNKKKIKKKGGDWYNESLKPESWEWKWVNSKKTIETERSHMTQAETKPLETQRQSIRRRMKERASLAGASGWLRLFNALINPLLKAKQRVSGFVLWPCDYSGINKGWAGNIDEIPPPLFCNKARGRDDTQYEICQHKAMLVRVLNKHVQYTCLTCRYKRS